MKIRASLSKTALALLALCALPLVAAPFLDTRGTWGQAYDDLWGLKRIGLGTPPAAAGAPTTYPHMIVNPPEGIPATLVFAVLSLVAWIVLRRVVGVKDGQVKVWDKDIKG